MKIFHISLENAQIHFTETNFKNFPSPLACHMLLNIDKTSFTLQYAKSLETDIEYSKHTQLIIVNLLICGI